jgi:hypothetical protein
MMIGKEGISGKTADELTDPRGIESGHVRGSGNLDDCPMMSNRSARRHLRHGSRKVVEERCRETLGLNQLAADACGQVVA